jgi:hypothetical protein
MTKVERKEFDELVCGSGCFKRPCYNKRADSDYLVYSDGRFRCHTHAFCIRVTPHRGKIAKWVGRYDGNNDAFKISLINRKIKACKSDLTVKPMKLVTQNGKTWVEIDGTKISPRRFSQQWWTFKFEREDR